MGIIKELSHRTRTHSVWRLFYTENPCFFFIFEMFQNRQALGHLTPQFTCTTPAVLKYVDLPTRIHSLGVKNLA